MSTLPVRVGVNSPAHWVFRAVWVLAAVGFVLYIPTQTQTSTVTDLTFAFELAMCAMALNLCMGYCGIISLGHSAFFAIGGYTTGVLVDHYGWSHGWTYVASPIIGFVVGCLVSLPALRLKGIYLALVTLGLAVLVPTLIRWSKLEWLTRGPRGINRLQYDEYPQLPFTGDDSPRDGRAIWMYWLAVFGVVVVYLVCRGIVKSRVGRSLIAIRDNETAAAVMGVNLAATKTVVFGISAAMCALAGSFFATRLNIVNATEMPMLTLLGSIIFLVVMVLGGAATLWGPMVGAVVYVVLDSRARKWGAGADSNTGITKFLFGWMTGSPASLILAVVLLVMMFVAPFGIVGLLKRWAARAVVLVPHPAGSASTVRRVDEADLQLAPPADPFDSITSGGDT
jgi:branched-chain amino acid transport system permease protein